MATITTSIRIDKDLKNEASKLAKTLGLSLGAVVSIYLKQFVIERKISLNEQTSDRKTVVDFGSDGASPQELLEDYETTYGEQMGKVRSQKQV